MQDARNHRRTRSPQTAGFDGERQAVRRFADPAAHPRPERVLVPARYDCPGCGGHLRLRHEKRRSLVILSGPVRLRRICQVSRQQTIYQQFYAKPAAMRSKKLSLEADDLGRNLF